MDHLLACLINGNPTKGVLVTDLDQASTRLQKIHGPQEGSLRGGSSQTGMQVNSGHNSAATVLVFKAGAFHY